MKENLAPFPSIAIVEDLEDVFSIRIQEQDAESTSTVSGTIELVKRYVGPLQGTDCLSRKCFHQTRKKLMSFAGISRDRIKLSNRIGELLEEKRWAKWIPLFHEVFPRTSAQKVISGPGCLVSTIPVLLSLPLGYGLYRIFDLPVTLVVGAVFAGILLGILIVRWLPDSQVRLPHYLSVRELVAQTVAEEITGGAPYCESDVSLAVRGILALHMDLPIEDIQLHHHLVDDLNLED